MRARLVATLVVVAVLTLAIPLNLAAVRYLSASPGSLVVAVPPVPTSTSAPPVTAAPAALKPGAPRLIGQGPQSPSAGVAPCPPAQVVVVVTTDKPTYVLGQIVQARSSARNQSPQACLWPGVVSFTWTDGAGTSLQVAQTDAEPNSVVWQPGQVLTRMATWDQHLGAGVAASAGKATVVATWGRDSGGYTASASFVVIDPTTTTSGPSGPTTTR